MKQGTAQLQATLLKASSGKANQAEVKPTATEEGTTSMDGVSPVTAAVPRMQINRGAQLWEKFILKAAELLPKYASKTAGRLPSCLIPDKARTTALVEKAVASAKANKVGSAHKTTKAILSLVPLPVINVGMPKAGSTTLFHFFLCNKFAATHQMKLAAKGRAEAYCMRDAVIAGLPPLATCAYEKEALMQMDLARRS